MVCLDKDITGLFERKLALAPEHERKIKIYGCSAGDAEAVGVLEIAVIVTFSIVSRRAFCTFA
jgi:hypothetical protein